MADDMVPRSPGYFSAGSRRYNEWQTLAFEATTDQAEEVAEEYTGPLVGRPSYPIPTKILTRTKKEENEAETRSTKLRVGSDVNEVVGDAIQEEWDDSDIEVEKCEPSKEAPAITQLVKSESKTDRDRAKENNLEPMRKMIPIQEVVKDPRKASFYHYDSGDLYAKDVDQHMAVLPEVATSTYKVTMDDIQVGDPGSHCQMIKSVCDN